MKTIKEAASVIKASREAEEREAAVKTAVYAAEQKYSHGENAEKLDYVISLLREQGYNTEKTADNITDPLRACIEAEVFKLRLREGKTGKSGTSADRANTPEEFREKYQKKRFTSGNAGKAQVLNLLYTIYQINAGVKRDTVQDLYPDLRPIRDKVKTYGDMNAYNSYYYLLEWQRPAFDSAVVMRNALKSVLADYADRAKTMIAGENIRREIGESASASLKLWLSTITIEAYTPQSNGYAISVLRQNIDKGLREMNAYNSFVELLARITEIPEYTALKVSMRPVYSLIEELNEALECLREDIATHRAEEIKPDATAGEVLKDLTLWTPEYLRETMRLFEPVEKEVPPVSDEAEAEAKARIRRDFKSQISWDSIYTAYSSTRGRKA